MQRYLKLSNCYVSLIRVPQDGYMMRELKDIAQTVVKFIDDKYLSAGTQVKGVRARSQFGSQGYFLENKRKPMTFTRVKPEYTPERYSQCCNICHVTWTYAVLV